MFGNLDTGEIIAVLMVLFIPIAYIIKKANSTSKSSIEDSVNNNYIQNVKEIDNQKKHTDSELFIEEIRKLHKLFLSEIDSEIEYQQKKLDLISELGTKKQRITPEDFLTDLIPLKESSILSSADITKIKQLLY